MPYKKIIPYINAENEVLSNVIMLAKNYSDGGADELLVYNFSTYERSREEFLKLCKELSRVIDIPFIAGCYIQRFEDVKKILYTGASKILLQSCLLLNPELLKEASGRFGAEKMMLEVAQSDFMGRGQLFDDLDSLGIGSILVKHIELSEHVKDKLDEAPVPVIIRDSLNRNDIRKLISIPNVDGIATNFYENKDIMKAKHALKQDGIEVNVFESSHSFSEFKLNKEGLLPVIAQDYKTGEVLMLAYMNEEAYNRTIAEGRMTYYSRSRGTLWLKGATSGHYQYVKELSIDCDKDTLLAKVLQIGAACHTGNRSCFYTNLVDKGYKNTDPFHVLQDVYEIILDRRKNPKEGSYTNYLFDKGIDKILKKCGEEAAEIIIAAKNPESGELRYEIADFLYHLMVLMAECGLDWKDITAELADRK